MTTIATWNLHHMGDQKAIPQGVVDVIEAQRSDVLVLTEYVDRGKRTDFRAELRRLGYREAAVSTQGKGQNQVLIASKVEQIDGPLTAPDVDEAAGTNFLHCRIPSLTLKTLNVVGFRVPHYQSEKPRDPEKLVKYWRQFKKMALEVADQRVVFIGDFNIGNEGIDEAGRKAVKRLVEEGFRLVGEQGGLDRALLSPELRLRSFSVIEAVGSHRLTGRRGETALSDHPMLVVEVE